MELDKYSIGNTQAALSRYKETEKKYFDNLKPKLKPPFINLPDTEVTESTKQNILIDNETIKNIRYISLKTGKSFEAHWHKETLHYILLMKGELSYYEKPIVNAKGVYLNKVKVGQMFCIPAMSVHEIYSEDSESQFYLFTNRSIEEERKDTFKVEYDIKNFPLISRSENPGEIEYIKRFSYENN